MPLSGPPVLTEAQRGTLMPLHPGPQMLLWQDRRKRQRHLAAWAESIRAS
ncbi:hypothetical protein [Mangrovicoccus ximenensis]|nr:hypothetical protein [Mangrovicoccus ximenensis]